MVLAFLPCLIFKTVMKKIFILYLAVLFSFSCEKIFIRPDPENDPASNFDFLWHAFDEKYSFFTFKNINWDSLYTVYRKQVYNGMSGENLFKVMDSLLYHLRDGHVRLVSEFDVSSIWKGESHYTANFNYDLLKSNYLKDNYRSTGSLINKEMDGIGYIYCRGFSGISSSQMDYVVKQFKNLKGIIIDVRNNGGGDEMTADIVASRFMDTQRLVMYELFKDGPGHNDFTSPVPRYLSPAGERFNGKVAVLVNRGSFSAANDFVLKMSVIPNVIIVGDTSGGGGGIPIDFELPNGWLCSFPTSQTLSPDYFNVEGGIPPDVPVNMREEDEFFGIDTILEKALELLKK